MQKSRSIKDGDSEYSDAPIDIREDGMGNLFRSMWENAGRAVQTIGNAFNSQIQALNDAIAIRPNWKSVPDVEYLVSSMKTNGDFIKHMSKQIAHRQIYARAARQMLQNMRQCPKLNRMVIPYAPNLPRYIYFLERVSYSQTDPDGEQHPADANKLTIRLDKEGKMGGVDGAVIISGFSGALDFVQFAVKISDPFLGASASTELSNSLALSHYVEMGKTQHFPLTYHFSRCDQDSTLSPLQQQPDLRNVMSSRRRPRTTTKQPYNIFKNKQNVYNATKFPTYIFSEKANGSVDGLLDKLLNKYNDTIPLNIFINICMQLHLCIASMHYVAGMTHRDTHLGNFLYIETELQYEREYWTYSIDSVDYYVPNLGFLIIINDFGRTAPFKDITPYDKDPGKVKEQIVQVSRDIEVEKVFDYALTYYELYRKLFHYNVVQKNRENLRPLFGPAHLMTFSQADYVQNYAYLIHQDTLKMCTHGNFWKFRILEIVSHPLFDYNTAPKDGRCLNDDASSCGPYVVKVNTWGGVPDELLHALR